MAKMGRPTKYKKKFCKMLIDHMKQGMSFESFAAIIGTHRDTLYDWLPVHSDFLDARKHGRELCINYWEKIYNQAALGFNKITINGQQVDIHPNASLLIFGMKNRAAWSDKIETTVENLKPSIITKRDGTKEELGFARKTEGNS